MKAVREVKKWKTKEIYEKVDEIDLETEYQRENIWSKGQKSLLVDSILQGIDIPKLYFAYFPDKNQYSCVDGKQRILTLVGFYQGDVKDLEGRKYAGLSENEKNKFDNYDFDVSIITNPTAAYITELFKRLNLGTPIIGAEMLRATIGDMRNFVFREIGKKGPFIDKTSLTESRYSRELAIAQMVINSRFYRGDEDFRRARYENLNEFFVQRKKFTSEDKAKTKAIKGTLEKMDEAFGADASSLKSRALIVSAYLFAEKLLYGDKVKDLSIFSRFYLELWKRIREELSLIKKFKKPTNTIILERFYRNLQQASVENYTIKRRNDFLVKAFEHFKKTGRIIGDKK